MESGSHPTWKAEAARQFELVYKELRQLAVRHMSREAPGRTLSPTALVSEAYLKLMNQQNCLWRSRSHFVALASRAMRQILIDAARRRNAARHFGIMVELDSAAIPAAPSLDLDQIIALDEALARLSLDSLNGPRQVQLLEMVWFGGMTLTDAAKELGVDRRTATRDSKYAKAWLAAHLGHA
jgi:RNA polymerase sigma factor (TIGR02999 family)